MKGSAAKIQMTGFDDLFGAPAPIAEGEHIQEVALSDLHPFKNHPFHVVDDERMQETAESVSKYGVLVPGIVRPREGGGYELISGHRRKRASELAGKGTMPVIVRELDDDESTIIMVDSNLQREKILPSEKAFAYRMKLDAMKRKAGRPSKENSGPVGQNLSRNELAENSPDSSRQIQRYVRLTNLVSVLLDMVDSDRLKLRPAVEISYLSQEEQGWLADVIDQQSIIPSMEQAQKLREQSQGDGLSAAKIIEILTARKAVSVQITLKPKYLRQYFPQDYTQEQMEEVIFSLLETWKSQNCGRTEGQNG